MTTDPRVRYAKMRAECVQLTANLVHPTPAQLTAIADKWSLPLEVVADMYRHLVDGTPAPEPEPDEPEPEPEPQPETDETDEGWVTVGQLRSAIGGAAWIDAFTAPFRPYAANPSSYIIAAAADDVIQAIRTLAWHLSYDAREKALDLEHAALTARLTEIDTLRQQEEESAA